MQTTPSDSFDLAIIGGGINGMGIARDAAGRGLRVFLCDKGDFASGTSSASSKLIHGGLRYLENFEFKLVREALHERETLLRVAPHLVSPLQFYLPIVQSMRPTWMIKTGLWLYKTLAGKSSLPIPRSVHLCHDDHNHPLKPEYKMAVSYYDGWVDDARLVIANALSAKSLGADLRNYTEFLRAEPTDQGWRIQCTDVHQSQFTIHAKCIVNAGGPWVNTIDQRCLNTTGPRTNIRLVKGSHIVTRRLYPDRHAYILQSHDGRVVFVLPFLDQFSLIGTTDIPISESEREAPGISVEEIQYLMDIVNRYFKTALSNQDVLWSFAGIRPLYDDGQKNPSKVTRDYILQIKHSTNDHVLCNILGGKITTYRHLAEKVLNQLRPTFPQMKPAWTKHAPLPGGECFDATELQKTLMKQWIENVPSHPWLPHVISSCIARHGNMACDILGSCRNIHDFGIVLAQQLCQKEIEYMISHEWVKTADDILYRRTKTGLSMSEQDKILLSQLLPTFTLI